MYIYLSIYIYIIKVYVCMYVRMYVHAYVYASVYMSRHPRNSPPNQAFALARGVAGLPTTHGTTRQGTTGSLPLPLPFDTQMRMMATLLCTMTSMCYSQCGCWWYLCSYVALGFCTACSLSYLVANRAWLVMFLRKLYWPLSFQAKFR